MKPGGFRRTIAEHLQACTAITREDIFGTHELKYAPINNVDDSNLMFAGYVGRQYQPRGCVLLAINPGGGGDSYRRTPEDDSLYPLLRAFKSAGPAEQRSAFDAINQWFQSNVPHWNIWRILGPTITAAGYGIEQVAYLNAVPYRTRGDKVPPVLAQSTSWHRLVAPALVHLDPKIIVGLGQKVGSIMTKFDCGPAATHIVPRTRGDSYVSPKAEAVLATLRRRRTDA